MDDPFFSAMTGGGGGGRSSGGGRSYGGGRSSGGGDPFFSSMTGGGGRSSYRGRGARSLGQSDEFFNSFMKQSYMRKKKEKKEEEASAAAKMREEAIKAKTKEAEKQAQQQGNKSKGGGFDLMKGISDVAKGISDAATQSARTIADSAALTWNWATGEEKKRQEQLLKAGRDRYQRIKQLAEQADKATNEEDRQRALEGMNNIRKIGDRASREYKEYMNETKKKADPVRNLAAGADLIGSALTFGVGGKALSAGAKAAGKAAFSKGGISAGLKALGGEGIKGIAKNVGKDAAIGAAFGANNELMNKGSEAKIDDVLKGAGLGAAVGAAAPGVLKGAGKALGGADKLAGKGLSKAVGVDQFSKHGVIGTLDQFLSRGIKKAGYATEDALNKTKLGSKLVEGKDNFMQKWVTDKHNILKDLRRADFEAGMGKSPGYEMRARELMGDISRSSGQAASWLENNPNAQALSQSLLDRAAAGKGHRIRGSGADTKIGMRSGSSEQVSKEFDEYAKIRSEFDLMNAGKKDFSKEKVDNLNKRWQQLQDKGVNYEKEYNLLTNVYKDDLKNRLDNGLISKTKYDELANNGFDYVRVQREQPKWLTEKPNSGATSSRKASLSSSETLQKLDKHAEGEQLSPLQVMMDRVNNTHLEATRNKAASEIGEMLSQTGAGKYIRTTDMINEKRALLTKVAEGKQIAAKLNRTLRTNKNAANNLRKEITALKAEGRDKLTRKMNETVDYLDDLAKKNPNGVFSDRQMADVLTSMSSTELRRLSRKIATRDKNMQPFLDRIETLNGQLKKVHEANRKNWWDANSIKTNPSTGDIPTFSFLKDGEKNIVQTSPEIAHAIHGWGKQNVNALTEFARRTNQMFKAGTTGVNPGFAIPNFIGDQVESAINSKHVLSTHNPINFMRATMMAAGKPLTKKDAQILEQYAKFNSGGKEIDIYRKQKDAAGQVSDWINNAGKGGRSLEEMAKNPKEALGDISNVAKRAKVKTSEYINPMKAGKAAWEKFQDAVGLTEDITRIQNFRGTYNKALKDGMSESAALSHAKVASRENSIDFNEAGEIGRVANAFIPYFNSSIQGSRAMARTLRDNPVSASMKIAAIAGTPTVASTAWNLSDKDRAAVYKDIPEYEKQNNFIIVMPGAHKKEDGSYEGVIKVKKPAGVGAFVEPVRKFMEYQHATGKDLSDFLKENGGGLAMDFASDQGPVKFSRDGKFDLLSTAGSVVPVAVKPALEAALNKDMYTGRDIVSDKLAENPLEEQTSKQKSLLGSALANQLGVAPKHIDHFIKGQFGELGTNIQNAADRLAGADDEWAGGRSMDRSITRRFSGAAGGAATTAFYDAYNPASNARKKASEQVTSLIQQGKINEAKRRANEYNETIAKRFSSFMHDHADSAGYDDSWNDKINKLYLSTSVKSFKARAKQARKK
jgi:hypothetical protein|nr:MAG TPA: Large polyvalent protein associated domain 38 [Caudoviricetes sp.]